MEVSTLNTETLRTGQSVYEFDDVSVELESGKQIFVEGNAEIDFVFENTGIFDEDKIEFNIDSCDVNIEKVWNDESEEINLNAEEMKLLQSEIETILRSQNVENY